MTGHWVLTYGYRLEYAGRQGFMDELFVVEQYRGRELAPAPSPQPYQPAEHPEHRRALLVEDHRLS